MPRPIPSGLGPCAAAKVPSACSGETGPRQGGGSGINCILDGVPVPCDWITSNNSTYQYSNCDSHGCTTYQQDAGGNWTVSGPHGTKDMNPDAAAEAGLSFDPFPGSYVGGLVSNPNALAPQGGGLTGGSMYLKVTRDCFNRANGTREITYRLLGAPGGADKYTVAEQLSDPNFAGSAEVGGFHDDLRPVLYGKVGATTKNTQYFLVYPTAQTLNSAVWVPIQPMAGNPIKFDTIQMTNGANPAQNIIKVNGKVAPDCK